MIKFLRHLFFDDFLLKLFSFVLAVLFWLTVSFAIQQNEGPAVSGLSLTPDLRMVLRLPVQSFSSNVEGKKLKFVPPEVDVILQGDARVIQELPTHEIRATVDLENADISHNSTNRVQVTLPAGAIYMRVVPPEVQVIVPSKN